MKRLVLLSLPWLAAAAAAQSVHDPVYLVGGMGPFTNTLYVTGVNKLDASGPTPTLTKLVQPGYYSNGFKMDADNQHVIFGVRGVLSTSTLYSGPKAGLFRLDPVSLTYTTLYAYRGPATMGYTAVYDVAVDQNGDYLAAVQTYYRSPYSFNYYVWKIDRSGTVSTLLSSYALGRRAYFYGKMTRDIDSGRLLVSDNSYLRSPTTIAWPVLGVDTDTGSVHTWNTGGTYGWYGYYCLPQNHRNGYIEGPYSRYIYRLKPGTSGRQTLATLSGVSYIYGGGTFDLQTAARPRQVFQGYGFTSSGFQTWLYHVDAATWKVTSIAVSRKRCYNYGFDFYRGRHTQTLRTAPRKWALRLSAPRFPGKAYAVAAGLSGVRPGIALPDGRNINLNLDAVVILTLTNRLPVLWNAGPGVLNARGEAAGVLDLSSLGGRLDIPLWIAWVILDPKAPAGIAYVPDTYVMRI